MAKFRKKPVVIEAWQYVDHVSLPMWLQEALAKPAHLAGAIRIQPDHQEGPRITIMTLEGAIYAVPNDWIIKGTKGELYPCKPDIFAEVYEEEVADV